MDIEKQYSLTRLSNGLSEKSKEQITKWRDCRKKTNRLSWHNFFLIEAYLVSIRSLDAQTKCGCVLTRDNTIIATGYNSFIRNIKDNVLPNLRPEKYPFMIHSEHNAILACAKNGISCDGATAYITGPPCISCLQYMYQVGINNIYYANANKAHMTCNDEHDINFEILLNLMPKMNIYVIDLDKEMSEKIKKIQSL